MAMAAGALVPELDGETLPEMTDEQVLALYEKNDIDWQYFWPVITALREGEHASEVKKLIIRANALRNKKFEIRDLILRKGERSVTIRTQDYDFFYTLDFVN